MPTTTRPRPSRPLLRVLIAPAHWLERARGRRRLALVLLYLLIAAVPGAYLWRAATLAGLPDVGDPFDVEAFRARTVPEAEDAVVYYRQAGARFREMDANWALLTIPLPEYRSRLAAWSGANREALEFWRRGTERPRAHLRQGRDSAPDDGGIQGNANIMLNLQGIAWLEAQRLEHAGDMAGAWAWYRAILRSDRHARMMFGFGYPPITANTPLALAVQAAARWAVDPRTDAPRLRQALADALSIEAMIAPLSDAYKVAYLDRMRTLDDVQERLLDQARTAIEFDGHEADWYRQLPFATPFRCFLKHEPTRARRIVRLVFANWLAHCDTPPHLRPKVVTTYPSLFDDAPAFHAPAPEELARWYESPGLARFVLPDFNPIESEWVRDRDALGPLIVTLAEELHVRERGALPDSPEELVGPYLKRLPDGYVVPAGATPSAP